MRVLELFCGIGGCAAALEAFEAAGARVVAAVDVNHLALETYRHNFPHPVATRSIESLDNRDFRRWRADLWWLSPPCQPFTRRGLGRDDADPRSRALLALLPRIAAERPPLLALENVPGFAGSRTHGLLRQTLEAAGYDVEERLLCPTELGVPNRRRRFYLLASREGFGPEDATVEPGLEFAACLDPRPRPELEIAEELLRRYDGALHRVHADDPAAVTACFTSAYGRSLVRSGSYLVQNRSVRRFSPAEILRLLDFPQRFTVPPGLGLERAWSLVGNSLSISPVRRVLRRLPPLAARVPGDLQARVPGDLQARVPGDLYGAR